MKLDYYERHLLALAVEACLAKHVSFTLPRQAFGVTPLADALTALLTDLGVQVPERPSEEALSHLNGYWGSMPGLGGWRNLYTRDPLLIMAVLEAGR